MKCQREKTKMEKFRDSGFFGSGLLYYELGNRKNKLSGRINHDLSYALCHQAISQIHELHCIENFVDHRQSNLSS